VGSSPLATRSVQPSTNRNAPSGSMPAPSRYDWTEVSPQLLRHEPGAARGDAVRGEHRVGTQPLHPARRGAQHEIWSAPRQPAQRQCRTTPAESRFSPSAGRRAVPIEVAALRFRYTPAISSGAALAHEPGGEERFPPLVQQIAPRAFAQVELGELLRDGRAALMDPAQVPDQRPRDSRAG